MFFEPVPARAGRMSTVMLRRLSGPELLARQEDARRVYAEAFTGPPWTQGASVADRFVLRTP
jgi:hypothetical protein